MKTIDLSNKRVVWLKKWQSNGYYPIEKAVNNNGIWSMSHFKLINGERVFNRFYGEYTSHKLIEHCTDNNMLISETEMFDTKNYNLL